MKTISIGRDDQCNIVLIDKTSVISRRHAVITIDNWGKMTITDYSANGTYINGIKMSSNVPVPITRKDSISFAHVSDLDWRLVPNVRGKLVSTISIAAAVIVIVGIALGIVFSKKVQPPMQEPIQPEVFVEPEKPSTDEFVTPQDDKQEEPQQADEKHKESKDKIGKDSKGRKTDKTKDSTDDTKQKEEAPIDPIIL